MANMPKSELERGSFIAYADEPNTVVSGSGGGGGAVYLEAEYIVESETYIPKFSYNDVKNAVEAGKIVCIRSAYTNISAGSNLIETHPVNTIAAYSDPVEYAVFADRLKFTADAPDVPMTYDNE